MKEKDFLSLLLAIVLLLSSCAGFRVRKEPPEIIAKRTKVVDAAKEMLGKKEIVVENIKFKHDCSGFVRATYIKSLGIDLFNTKKASSDIKGTELIYTYCKKNGKIYKSKFPFEGDIVFFNDTYDADNNTKPGDYLTHIGVVEKVNRKGTITFIHLGSKRITRENMNLKYPNIYRNKKDNSILNGFLRKKSQKEDSNIKVLSGELFESFGSVIK